MARSTFVCFLLKFKSFLCDNFTNEYLHDKRERVKLRQFNKKAFAKIELILFTYFLLYLNKVYCSVARMHVHIMCRRLNQYRIRWIESSCTELLLRDQVQATSKALKIQLIIYYDIQRLIMCPMQRIFKRSQIITPVFKHIRPFQSNGTFRNSRRYDD